MKTPACLVAFVAILSILSAQTPAPTAMPSPTSKPTSPLPPTVADATTIKLAAGKMDSQVIPWEPLTPTPTGARRSVFEAPTPTLDKFHCHISTLNPGENTGPLHRHPQEELVILKEGTLEINIEGKKTTATAGAMIFYAANANENMTNIGKTPATYYVIQFYTALTPKS